jgi:Tol biopolymer transport system component
MAGPPKPFALDPDETVATIERLRRRIADRFPGSGLEGLAAALLDLARDAVERARGIRAPCPARSSRPCASGAALVRRGAAGSPPRRRETRNRAAEEEDDPMPRPPSSCCAFITPLAIAAGAGSLLAGTWRVSVDSAGAEGHGTSAAPALSADGRYVAFESDATNLVPGDGNGFRDVFVRDRAAGTTMRASVDSAGVEGDGGSSAPALSADGLVVAFHSLTKNLVAGNGNGVRDVFVHDCATGTTTRVSVDSAGVEGNDLSRDPAISGDGLAVAFESRADDLVAGDSNNVYDVFVHDRVTGTTTRVSVDSAGAEGNSHSQSASLSGDGRYVAFESFAWDLVAGDGNGTYDAFVHDRLTATTVRASLDSTGLEGNGPSRLPSISTDGRFVTFESHASDLVAADANDFQDLFVRDLQTGKTRRASVDTAGAEADGFSEAAVLSADGRFVAFDSLATNLVAADGNGAYDVFVQGPFFILEADPETAAPGVNRSLTTFTGLPGGLTLLVVVDLNGTPTFLQVAIGAFDSSGVWVVSGVVPSGLTGTVATFQCFGIAPNGKADYSNLEVVTFS